MLDRTALLPAFHERDKPGFAQDADVVSNYSQGLAKRLRDLTRAGYTRLQ